MAIFSQDKKGKEMINFTIGPVMSSPDIIEVANRSAPYFRTTEFSSLMLESEKMMLDYVHAPEGSRCVFLTASGTGAMESCVMNVLNKRDKVLVINGGTFGQRFADLCRLHQLDFSEVKCEFGTQVSKSQLERYNDQGYTAMLVNMNETSSGLLYDMNLISEFCRKNHMLLMVDAISAFITDEIDMGKLGVSVFISSSQKALALFPGVSFIVLTPAIIDRVKKNPERSMYLSLKLALQNMERGQTPFTPAVITLIQIHQRLNDIKAEGGIQAERIRIRSLALAVRDRIQEFPFEFVVKEAKDRSNAVTALRPLTCGAKEIFNVLKDQYGIWVCPNGGELADKVFRIGHIGYITKENMETLWNALEDLSKRKII